MKNFTKLLLIGSLSISFFASCRKEAPAPTSGPGIEILSPKPGITIDTGDVVNILAKISHESGIHEYGYKLTNETTGEIVAQQTTHSHGNEGLLDENWLSRQSGHFEMKLEVEAIDHAGNRSSKEVKFHCR